MVRSSGFLRDTFLPRSGFQYVYHHLLLLMYFVFVKTRLEPGFFKPMQDPKTSIAQLVADVGDIWFYNRMVL